MRSQSATADTYESFRNWRHEAVRVLQQPVGVHLDLCVGNSNFAHQIPSEIMIGVDLDRERLQSHCDRYLPLYMDAREVPERFFDDTVDLATMFDALEHLPKQDGLELLAALERVANSQVLLFVPVENWNESEEAQRLKRWDDGAYGIHLSTWHPDELRDLGYEVLYNPTYHQRPHRTFGAMFCWKTLSSCKETSAPSRQLTPITKAEVDAIAEDTPYYRGRWSYLGKAAEVAGRLNVGSCLEVGAYRFPLLSGATTMSDQPGEGVDVVHDATNVPWPFEDDAFDLFVALQVWEHLDGGQIDAFSEAMRVSRRGLLSFPIEWDIPEDPVHHMITRDRITEWTLGVAPVEEHRLGARLLCLWDFRKRHLASEVVDGRRALKACQEEVRLERQKVERVRQVYESSRSWRATRPLRAARQLLRRRAD